MDTTKHILLAKRKLLAVIAAALMLLDNATTLLAVENGTVETNPIAAAFLGNPILWLLFTIVKMLAAYILTLEYVRDLKSLLIWTITMTIFTRAIIINTINSLK